MSIDEKDNLNLPDAPDFISEPPDLSPSEMIRLCEPLLAYWNRERYSKPEPPFVGDAFTLDDF